MMPMTPRVAPMISVLRAPVWIASQTSFGPILVSFLTQLTAMHDRVAQNASQARRQDIGVVRRLHRVTYQDSMTIVML